jgi:hypothetical protein
MKKVRNIDLFLICSNKNIYKTLQVSNNDEWRKINEKENGAGKGKSVSSYNKQTLRKYNKKFNYQTLIIINPI